MIIWCVAVETAHLHKPFDQGRSASEDPLGDERKTTLINQVQLYLSAGNNQIHIQAPYHIRSSLPFVIHLAKFAEELLKGSLAVSFARDGLIRNFQVVADSLLIIEKKIFDHRS